MDSNAKAHISGINTSAPVRLSLVASTLVTILISGILTCLIWFQVETSHSVSGGAKVVFVIAGAVEIMLFLASILGFVGAVIRKRQLVAIYAYFLYAHFVINVAVTSVYIWMVGNTRNTDTVTACQESATDDEAAARCTGVLKITKGVFIGFGLVLLLLEFYVALSSTLLLRGGHVKKGVANGSRMRHTDSGSTFLSPLSRNVSTNPSDSGIRLVTQPPTPQKLMLSAEPVTLSNMSFSSFEFDPYKSHTPTYGASPVASGPHFDPALDPTQRYGGSMQTYAEVADREGMRVKDIDTEAVGESSERYSIPLAASKVLLSSRPTSAVSVKPSIVMGIAISPETPDAGLNIPLITDQPLPSRPASIADTQILVSSKPLLADAEASAKTRPTNEVDANPPSGPTSFHRPLAEKKTVSRPTSTASHGISQSLGASLPPQPPAKDSPS